MNSYVYSSPTFKRYTSVNEAWEIYVLADNMYHSYESETKDMGLESTIKDLPTLIESRSYKVPMNLYARAV